MIRLLVAKQDFLTLNYVKCDFSQTSLNFLKTKLYCTVKVQI